jgi:hypothetical protein
MSEHGNLYAHSKNAGTFLACVNCLEIETRENCVHYKTCASFPCLTFGQNNFLPVKYLTSDVQFTLLIRQINVVLLIKCPLSLSDLK